MSSMTSQQITIGYWSIRGLAAPLRMMMMHAGVPFHSRSYDVTVKEGGGWDFSDWHNEKPALKEKNPLMNLPYVVDGDVVIVQTNACFLYLGRKCKMLGTNELELTQCEQLLCEVYDLRDKVVGYAYSAKGTDSVATVAFLESTKSHLEKLELWLNANKAKGNAGPYFVGASATAPDFHAWEMFDQLGNYASVHSVADPVASYPSLVAFRRDFAALPANARYFASKLSQMPMNNIMASSGSLPAPTHAKWNGEPIDWHKASGTY